MLCPHQAISKDIKRKQIRWQGHYVLGQCATWAIMSGNWNSLDDFRNQMEVLLSIQLLMIVNMQNLKQEI